jgi:flagellar protein FlbD
MIVVTRLNDSQFAINPDLIERIHSNPDTTLVMVDGAKYIVTESMDDVIQRIAAYRARVLALAYEHQPTTHTGPRQLEIVASAPDDFGPGPVRDAGDSVPRLPRRL